MLSIDHFGVEHSSFRFRFSSNTLPEMMLKLSGFPADDVMSTGWRIQPLLIPPLVSEQYNVIIRAATDTGLQSDICSCGPVSG